MKKRASTCFSLPPNCSAVTVVDASKKCAAIGRVKAGVRSSGFKAFSARNPVEAQIATVKRNSPRACQLFTV